jgi:hypothetical protein
MVQPWEDLELGTESCTINWHKLTLKTDKLAARSKQASSKQSRYSQETAIETTAVDERGTIPRRSRRMDESRLFVSGS